MKLIRIRPLCKAALFAWCSLSPHWVRVYADSGPCASIATAQDVLNCAKENHPDIRRVRFERLEGESLEPVARQRPNPELDSKFGALSLSNDAELSTEVSLLHTFELGGKRGSRIERAQAELQQRGASLEQVREEIATQTLLSLHRLRQIEEELTVLTETIETFQKQAQILRSRPTLTPEQDVSFSIFDLATEDGEFKRTLLSNEKEALIRNLQVAMGAKVSYSKSWLPEEPGTWPNLNPVTALSPNSSDMRLLQSQLAIAEAELGLARSEAWPDVKSGPFFESQSAGGVKATSLGLQISLPLPLYHQNAGGKTLAQVRRTLVEETLRSTQNTLQSEREREIHLYQASVTQLQKSRWHQQYERRHQRVESLFRRGVLASPMVIEAHRQILEVQKTSHELELKALESLYRIRILDGSLPEARL